jgi:hypothetical protein
MRTKRKQEALTQRSPHRYFSSRDLDEKAANFVAFFLPRVRIIHSVEWSATAGVVGHGRVLGNSSHGLVLTLAQQAFPVGGQQLGFEGLPLLPFINAFTRQNVGQLYEFGNRPAVRR